jgi:ribosomal protein S18 acetylase RimI-like enzyme
MYTIRPWEKADLERGLLETLQVLRPDVPVATLECARQLFKLMHGNPVYNIWVAVDDATGRVIGTLTVLILHDLLHGGRVLARMENVAVHKDYQGNGVARALIEKGNEVVVRKGGQKARLNCSKGNRELYEKFGYKQEEEIAMRRIF